MDKSVEKTKETVQSDGWASKSRAELKKFPPTPGQNPEDEFYDMSHQNRGIALIFNHKHFDSLYFKERKGTELDRDAMEAIFKKLKFHVEVYSDFTKVEILEALRIVSRMDHSHNDCLVIAVMSHGRSHGRIFARDYEYTTHELVEFFSGENCPSLAGKPKLFFIQACRGEKTDAGVQIRVESDNIGTDQKVVYSIPVMADILIMYATVEGYYAWRDTAKGSCFIQALVKKLEEYHSNRDLLSILTLVNREVAVGFQSNSMIDEFHNKKEMCSIVKDEAKNKWKNLRDHFKKELNKVPKGKSGASQESASEYTGRWSYFYQMLFLKDILLPRNTESNLQDRVDLPSPANDNTQNSTQKTNESEDETQITDELEHTTLSQSEPAEPEILGNEPIFAVLSTESTNISTVPKKKTGPTKTTPDRSTFETELLRIESENTLLLQMK